MCATGFLHKLLSPVMHNKRLLTLMLFVNGLLLHKNLSLTGLGRGINLSIQERSGIRRADRFLGNEKLYKELKFIYGQYIKNLIGSRRKPKIIVDWSHAPNTKHHVLRAALAAKGRSVTLYEEVHPEKKLGNAKVESKFLLTLKQLLPDCCPIIITDAGFRTPWFKVVLKLGWDYIGRIRGTYKYLDGNEWADCKNLITTKVKLVDQYLGKLWLCTRNSILTHLFLYKEKAKKRTSKRKYRRNQGGSDRVKYSNSAKEAWLLASSLSGSNWLKRKSVIKIYKMRMQIEEGFRDLKCAKYGFGLRDAYSKDTKRIAVLLLIAMLSSLIAWLAGCIAEENGWQYQFQSSSTKKRRELSLFFLGCRVVKRNINRINDRIEYELPRVSRFVA